MRWLVLALVLLAACEDSCPHPDEVTFSCAPVAPGPNTCAPQHLGAYDYDTTETYPTGCTITFPFCNKFYPDSVADSQCDGATWSCPI